MSFTHFFKNQILLPNSPGRIHASLQHDLQCLILIFRTALFTMYINLYKSVSHSVMSDSLHFKDYNSADSSNHGILQATVLEWVAITFSGESSRPRDWTWVSQIAGRLFTVWATKEDPSVCISIIYLSVCLLDCELLGSATTSYLLGFL